MILTVTILPILISSALGAAVRADGASCPLFCNLEPEHLICGTDNATYKNKCYFHKAQCMDPGLQKAHDGACMKARRGIVCTTPMCMPMYVPVCGSDGQTYDNECSLYNAKCDNEGLKMEHHGPCTAVFD